jgi:dihydroorotate dehydrogenase (NAD+) catalytic subunit
MLRWNDLVRDLAQLTSASAVAKRIGVEDREVRRWKQGKARPQGHSADKLLRECEDRGINWRNYQRLVPAYDYRNTYEGNLREGPQGLSANHNPCLLPIRTRFLGHDLNSPIGLSASPLTANSDWIGVFARYGYDIITAKTVRTVAKKAHSFPNWVHLPGLSAAVPFGAFPDSVLGQLDLPDSLSLSASGANSFGMPSPDPEVWMADLIRAKSLLSPGQILIASIVGTADEPGDDLIGDFVECGKRAAEAEPHAIEVNLSCPNVYGEEGSLCSNPDAARAVCERLAAEVKTIPMLVKIGYLPTDQMRALFLAVYKHVHGFTAINTIPAIVLADGQRSEPLFPGGKRGRAGVSGIAIREYAAEAARSVKKLTQQYRKDLENIGVGGISSADDVSKRLDAGTKVVQLCTAVNLNPLIGQQIRKQLSSPESDSPTARFDGGMVTFSDPYVKAAFTATSEVCQQLGIPFDIGLNALRQHWLDRYQRDRDRLRTSKNAARGGAPSKNDIEAWIRYAIAHGKRR